MIERSSCFLFYAALSGQGFYRIGQLQEAKGKLRPEPSNRPQLLNTEKRSATDNLRRSGSVPGLPYPPQADFVFGLFGDIVKGFSAYSNINGINSRHKISRRKDLRRLWRSKKNIILFLGYRQTRERLNWQTACILKSVIYIRKIYRIRRQAV